MTLNVVWSDARGAKYLLCDSARTHLQEPRFTHSILGQLQRNRRNYAVEEGAQKIVRLTATAGAALCGSEYDALEFLRMCMHAYSTGDQTEFNRYMRDPPDVPTEISIAEAGSPISIFQPHNRAILELRPSELSIRGSLDEGTCELLAQAIGRNLIERGDERTAEEKLVHALGYAMTIAAQFNLTEHGVGGSFFGATLTESGFSWQPDILYVLYTPATVGNAFGENRIDELDANVNRVIAQVRDDVGVSASLTVGRIVIASSRSMTPRHSSMAGYMATRQTHRWFVPC